MHVSVSLQVKFHCSCLAIFMLTNVFATNACAMCLQIKCLYSKTQNILTVCVPPEDMSGRPFYTTMNPHDLSGDTTDLDYERSTVDSCAEYCYDYQYFGYVPPAGAVCAQLLDPLVFQAVNQVWGFVFQIPQAQRPRSQTRVQQSRVRPLLPHLCRSLHGGGRQRRR